MPIIGTLELTYMVSNIALFTLLRCQKAKNILDHFSVQRVVQKVGAEDQAAGIRGQVS